MISPHPLANARLPLPQGEGRNARLPLPQGEGRGEGTSCPDFM